MLQTEKVTLDCMILVNRVVIVKVFVKLKLDSKKDFCHLCNSNLYAIPVVSMTTIALCIEHFSLPAFSSVDSDD